MAQSKPDISGRMKEIEDRELKKGLGGVKAKKKKKAGGLTLDEFQKQFSERETESTEARFAKLLEGKFDQVPSGFVFESLLPDVNTITLNPPSGDNRDEIPVTVSFTDRDPKGNETAVTETVSLRKNKTFYPYPASLARTVRENELLREILNAVEAVNIKFWHALDTDILQKGEGEPRGEGIGEKRDVTPLTPEDLKRLEFYTNIPGLAFGFYSDKGLADYKVLVFTDGFCILENPNYGNAAFIIDGTPEVPALASTEEIEAFATHPDFLNKIGLTKDAVQAGGAKRIVHGKGWERRTQNEIDSRQIIAQRRREEKAKAAGKEAA